MKPTAAALLATAALLASCGEAPAPPSDPFTGTWESHSFWMRIERDGDVYHIDLDNHRGMLSGQYTGRRVGSGIALELPLAGEQVLRETAIDDRLEFIGETLERTGAARPSGAPERRDYGPEHD